MNRLRFVLFSLIILPGYLLAGTPLSGAWFDAGSAFYEADTALLGLGGAYSVELVVQPAADCPEGAMLVDLRGPGTRLGTRLYLGAGRHLVFETTAPQPCLSPEALPADRSSHVVAVFNAREKIAALYIDGKRVAAYAADPKERLQNPSDGMALRVGADQSGGRRFHGLLQRLTVHGRVLSEKEIAGLGATVTATSECLASWRFGGVVYGRLERERIQLNEDTIWSGAPYAPENPEAPAAIRRARELVFEGKQAEAEELVAAHALGRPSRMVSYQTLGSVILEYPEMDTSVVDAYARSLDLSTAVATTRYTRGDVTYTREVFSSSPDQLVVIRLSADRPGSITVRASWETPFRTAEFGSEDGALSLSGRGGDFDGKPGAIRFHALLEAKAEGGTTQISGRQLCVRGAPVSVGARDFEDGTGDGKGDVWSEGLGDASQHRSMARDGAGGFSGHWHVAHGRCLAHDSSVGALSLHGES